MMKSQSEIETILSQCTGSEGYHYNSITKAMKMVYTDGIKLMADECQAWWLVDTIVSQQPQCMRDEMLRDMQFWNLKVNDGSAILICERDEDDVFITQKIPYSDFPLPEVKVWLEKGMAIIDGQERQMMIAMLPQER